LILATLQPLTVHADRACSVTMDIESATKDELYAEYARCRAQRWEAYECAASRMVQYGRDEGAVRQIDAMVAASLLGTKTYAALRRSEASGSNS